MLVGALERWCVCKGEQPIKINVVVKVGEGGGQYIGGPPYILKWGGISPLLQRP